MTYVKDQQGFEEVVEVEPRMAGKEHKTFTGVHGKRWVFDVAFKNGFIAEYASPTLVQDIFAPGKKVEFKVIGKNTHGYTIEPLSESYAQAAVYAGNFPGDTTKTSIIMSGHAAVFALGFAKDLAPHNDWDLKETLTGAEEIFKWLKDHR